MQRLGQAQTLRDAYTTLDPLCSLSGNWMQHYYVERPEECSINGLLDELQLDRSEDDKTLFTGYRGSGKTTELHRLEEALQGDHLVVFMNVEEFMNLGDIHYTDLLVLLGLEVFRVTQKAGFRTEERLLKDLRFWYEEHILEKAKGTEAEVSFNLGLDLLIAKLGGRIKSDASRRETIRSATKAHLSDLLERLNCLLQELHEKVEKRILVIVDGLDKVYDLSQVRDLFLQGANALLEPRCRIIYTVPYALSYSNDFQQVRLTYPRFYILPNIKTHQADRWQPYSAGVNMLEEVLHRRVAPALLSGEAKKRLIEYSGGLLKELISLARSSLVVARRLRGDQGPIQADDVEYAVQQVQNTFRALLTEDQYRELARILDGGPFVNSFIAQELIHNLSLLAYDGGRIWWDVHPIVRPLVEEWKRECNP